MTVESERMDRRHGTRRRVRVVATPTVRCANGEEEEEEVEEGTMAWVWVWKRGGLLGAESTVACIAQTWHDVSLLAQLRIDHGGVHAHALVFLGDLLQRRGCSDH